MKKIDELVTSVKTQSKYFTENSSDLDQAEFNLPHPAVSVNLATRFHSLLPTPMPKKTTTKSKSSENNIDFEKTMQELEKLVERMEKGDLTLEQSLKDFERGVELTRQAQSALRDAEQKVQLLMKNAGQDQLVDFEEDPDA